MAVYANLGCPMPDLGWRVSFLLASLTTEGNVAVLCNDAGEHFSAPCKDLDLDHSQRERGVRKEHTPV